MESLKLFLGVWFCVVLTVASCMGLCKIGGALFDVDPSHTSDAVTGCHENGGTVTAENGEYKSCSFKETK